MDRPNDGTHAGPSMNAPGSSYEGRRSTDTTSRLQKKRSIRNTGSGPPRSREGYAANTTAPGAATNQSALNKARKGSLRDAVRRIFTRQPRDSQPPPVQRASPPRHHAHYSEPTATLPSPRRSENPPRSAEPLPHPLRSSPVAHFPRMSSPSTGAFPNSGKLKPLDLGNPQIRRRKTLPNVQLSDLEIAAMASSPLAAPPIPPTANPLLKTRTSKEAKRRSRSAGDLRQSAEAAATTARNRKEEIKYWRESFQLPPTRESVVTSYTARSGDYNALPRDEEIFPKSARGSNMFDIASSPSRPGTANPRSSPPERRGLGVREADVQSASNYGTEMSSELEDRVAKLEAGLQNFQASLLRLTADRNRRTVVVGNDSSSPRSARDTRTPSMLADTLQGPFQPSSYEFEYGFNTRQPFASPPQPQRRPPQTPQPVDDPFGPEPPGSAAGPSRPESFRPPASREGPSSRDGRQAPPPPLPPPLPVPGSSHSSSGQQPEYTFRSLYQMLNDERSARRRLQQQFDGLQQEISVLSSQISASNVQSQRSSFIYNSAGSRQLAALLRETESSPPGTPERGAGRAEQRISMLSADSAGQPVVSRFSQSESEAGAEDELPTPVEAYQTPREAWSMHNLRGRGGTRDSEMF